ncbi:MAG: PAS domain-containing hybrid sensor histidine kinase/response regulator [Candidatus Anammoxibacter sp.]
MKNENSNQKKVTDLRGKAEEKLKPESVAVDNLSDEEVRKLAHELQVHQIELEIQNEELRTAQILIEESRGEYTDLYDFAPVGYLTFNIDRQIVKSNLTIAGMLEEERSALNNKTFYRHIVKDDADIFHLHLQKIFQGKVEERCELRLKRGDGALFYAQLDSIYVKDSEGNEFCRTSITDITKRKKAEKEIRLLSCAIEQSPASVVITDNKGDIEYVNPQFTKTSGYSKDEVIGRNPRILKSGEQPYDVYVRLWSTITAGYEWKGRFCNKKKNGELYWEYQSVSPIKDENGDIINFVSVKIDDTERMRAEEDAHKSDRRFARMLEVSEDAIVSIDEGQKIIIFNKGAERVFGYTADEIRGKTIETLIPERFRTNHKKNVEDFGRSETESVRLNDRQYDLFGRKKNGDEFPAEISISKFEEDGKMIFTAVVHDITLRRKMEEEAFKAQKLESVGILAGGIAHDFNNILTAILGNTNLADILIKTGDRDKATEALSNIERASVRARDLTQQLLTFSKGGTPVKNTVSITGIIKESSGFALKGSNVKCEFSITEDLWPVEVDEGQINQVINNIVINAEQVMPHGGTLKIDAKNVTKVDKELVTALKNRKHIKISITDQGSGIKKEHLPNIFDPYFTTKQTGSGLGLASSYSIIKKHGGIITVESEPGVGSTFHIYLPASTKTVKKEEETLDLPIAAIAGSGKILIMDDNDAIRDMGSETLGFIGYEVECAEDGDKAIDMYKKAMDSGNPFDVVIMDLTIPGGMGGKEAIKELHKIDAKAKAIVFSGYSNDPIMSAYEQFGFKGVIGKPFELKAMNEVLKRVMGS